MPESSAEDVATHTPKIALQVLTCQACGAAVPLTAGETVACPYCQATVVIPSAYRALREVEDEAAAKRTKAQQLFKVLGNPPGRFLRLWAGASLGLGYLFLLPLVFVFAGIAISKGTDAISSTIHANLADVLTNAQYFSVIGALMFTTLGLPIVLGVYGRRRTDSRQRIQAALAALPPKRAGAPMGCRKCAAPLPIKDDALGETCYYCGTDNLVHLPESWISKARGKITSLGATIEEAAEQDALMRSRERRSLRNQLLALGLIFPVMFGFGKALDSDKERMPPRWQTAIKGDRRLIYASKSSLGSHVQALHPPHPISQLPLNIVFDKEECLETGGCLRSYYVALRDNEKLLISGEKFPQRARALGFNYYTQTNSLFDDWSRLGEHRILYADQTLEFRAPRSAWYQVELICSDCTFDNKSRFVLRVNIEAAR
ncbi:MAG: hypothetical protein AB1757_11895 [Acidobacteriota bacterium]